MIQQETINIKDLVKWCKMIQIAICDDDKKDVLHLRTILREIMDKFSLQYNIKEYDSGEKLLEAPLAFHLIFLDIVMDGKDGIEIGKQIFRKIVQLRLSFKQILDNIVWRQ